METIVIGHKNPDMDSICSAIGYARLKTLQGMSGVSAARAGNTNKRIDFVLEKFGFEPPPFVSDVSPRVADVMERHVVSVRAQAPAYEAINLIEQKQFRGLPVTDENGRCLGLLSAFKVSQHLLPGREKSTRARQVKASLADVVASFGGTVLTATPEETVRDLVLTVGGMSPAEFSRRVSGPNAARHVLFVGDRDNVQRMAIENGVRAIIVTGGLPVTEETLGLARERQVTMISSPLDTASTVLLARGAVRIAEMIDADFRSFRPETPLEAARIDAARLPYFVFPVLDGNGCLAGILSKSDLLKPVPRRLILVDHNELSQAVDGADKIEIIEILDHHRLGGYATRGPIHFWNNPVGSTSTIVALCYRQAGIPIPRDVAGLLMAGMVSDTLNLTSPTATDIDRDILKDLARTAGVDPATLANEIFSVGSALMELTPAEVVSADCKEYEDGGKRFAVAQIEELGLAELDRRREPIAEALQQLVRDRNLLFAVLLVTDITSQNSILLAAGASAVIERIDYPAVGPRAWELAGVVSRKKQLLPYLLQLLHSAPAKGAR